MLDTLVVSVDVKLMSTVQLACTKLGITSKLCAAPSALPAILAHSKIYAVVVDEADRQAVTEMLNALRTSKSSRQAITIGVNGHGAGHGAGMAFVMPKPVTNEAAVRILRVAQGSMLNEYRRYMRLPLQTPVDIITDAGQEIRATCFNISQRGLGIQFADLQPLSPQKPVTARVVLPPGVVVEMKGTFAWHDRSARAGLACTGVTQRHRDLLEHWLSKHFGTRI